MKVFIRHYPDISQEDLFLIMIGGNDLLTIIITKGASKKLINKAITEIYTTH
ncbi:MAG: hypothetical protein ABI045_01715 [Flavobacteriales bacterium]